jgi:hypothetical protein
MTRESLACRITVARAPIGEPQAAAERSRGR